MWLSVILVFGCCCWIFLRLAVRVSVCLDFGVWKCGVYGSIYTTRIRLITHRASSAPATKIKKKVEFELVFGIWRLGSGVWRLCFVVLCWTWNERTVNCHDSSLGVLAFGSSSAKPFLHGTRLAWRLAIASSPGGTNMAYVSHYGKVVVF